MPWHRFQDLDSFNENFSRDLTPNETLNGVIFKRDLLDNLKFL